MSFERLPFTSPLYPRFLPKSCASLPVLLPVVRLVCCPQTRLFFMVFMCLHSMIGMSERALDYMVDRVKCRQAFGKPLAEQGTILTDIATSRCEVRACWCPRTELRPWQCGVCCASD